VTPSSPRSTSCDRRDLSVPGAASCTCRAPTSVPWRRPRGLPADAVILDLEDAVAPDAKARPATGSAPPRPTGATATARWSIRANGSTPSGSPTTSPRSRRPVPTRCWSRRSARSTTSAPSRTHCEAGRRARPHLHLGDARDADRGPPTRPRSRQLRTADGLRDGDQRPRQGARPSSSPAGHRCCPRCRGVVLAAREAGKHILDGVFNDLDDADGFEAECRQGREFGFDGKTLIHPAARALQPRVRAPTSTRWTAPAVIEAIRGGAGGGPRRGHRRRADDREPPRGPGRRTLAQAEAIAATEG
jgi:citrate lyase subunit beta / citryl-CoA lyase